MRLSHVILGEILYYDPDFEKQTDKIKDRGGVYLGSGDYGSAYLLNGRVYKVTTDEIELQHAKILKSVIESIICKLFDDEPVMNRRDLHVRLPPERRLV